MDRRLHERLTVKLTARLINLTRDGTSLDGLLQDVSRAGISLALPGKSTVGDLVRVECQEGTLFGQIVHVTPEGLDFRTGVAVFEVLLGGSDLSKLMWSALRLAPPTRRSSRR